MNFMRKIISVVIIIIGIFLILIIGWYWRFHVPKERKNVEFRMWQYSKDSLRHFVYSTLEKNKNIEFYNPYRAVGLQNILRVTYEDSLTFDFDGSRLVPLNEIDEEKLDNRLSSLDLKGKKVFLGDIMNSINALERNGIYYLSKSDSTLSVVTSYYDSTFEVLKARYPLYKEKFYESDHFQGAQGRKFVISFLFITKELSTSSILRLENGEHYLWKLDSVSYYYRLYVPHM